MRTFLVEFVFNYHVFSLIVLDATRPSVMSASFFFYGPDVSLIKIVVHTTIKECF